jgi:integrase
MFIFAIRLPRRWRPATLPKIFPGHFMPMPSEPFSADHNSARYFLVLGAAAADLWSHLPQELQHTLFERAVVLGHQGERDESLREQLAKFLHHQHERTQSR